MNILNNGRFGMVAGLSGTMKMAIQKSIVSFYEGCSKSIRTGFNKKQSLSNFVYFETLVGIQYL
jgi:hypothetical protein